MSDADRPTRRVTRDASRVPANRDAFLAAFAEKGCTTGDSRAELMGTSRRNVYKYMDGDIIPTLPTARRIAAQLGRDIDDLWPASTKAAA